MKKLFRDLLEVVGAYAVFALFAAIVVSVNTCTTARADEWPWWAEADDETALADACAVAWDECLDRSDVAGDLVEVGAEDWQLVAIAAIRSGTVGKGPVDYVRVSADEVALGWAHMTACRWGRLDFLGCDPNASSLDDYWDGLAVMYSDAGPGQLFAPWSRSVDRVDRLVVGCGDRTRSTVAAITNTGPRLARRLVERCGCDRRCLVDGYATTPRREARMAELEDRR